MRAARDLTAKLMDLDVTGIFFIVLGTDLRGRTHFGTSDGYVVCCETWAESVSRATMGAARILQGRSAPWFVFVGWGLIGQLSLWVLLQKSWGVLALSA